MRKRYALTAPLLAGAVLATAIPTAASAIDGGSASNNPAIVSLASYGSDGNTQECTGVQVSESVILTAKHCDSGGTMFIHWPTGSNGEYELAFATAARTTATPEGDLSVVRLATPHPLASYPKVNARYVSHPGDKVTIYGARLQQQRTLDGYVFDEGFESFDGPTIELKTPGGGPRSGDSGGPVLVNGEVVGVLSRANLGDDSWYTRLSGVGPAALIADQLPGTNVGNLGDVSSAPYYEIKNVASGLALDVRESSTSVGAQTTQQPFTGASSQQWTLVRDGSNVRILNRKSGLVIGVPAGSHAVGEKTVQWSALGVRDQAWSAVQQPGGTFTFTNGESGQVLSALTTAAGSAIVQDNTHGSTAEKWTLVRVG